MRSKASCTVKTTEASLARLFQLTNIHVQYVQRKDRQGELCLIDFSGLGNRITVSGLRRICDEISKFIGGTLYGTVNLDYSGDAVSVEMMVELE